MDEMEERGERGGGGAVLVDQLQSFLEIFSQRKDFQIAIGIGRREGEDGETFR